MPVRTASRSVPTATSACDNIADIGDRCLFGEMKEKSAIEKIEMMALILGLDGINRCDQTDIPKAGGEMSYKNCARNSTRAQEMTENREILIYNASYLRAALFLSPFIGVMSYTFYNVGFYAFTPQAIYSTKIYENIGYASLIILYSTFIFLFYYIYKFFKHRKTLLIITNNDISLGGSVLLRFKSRRINKVEIKGIILKTIYLYDNNVEVGSVPACLVKMADRQKEADNIQNLFLH